jgi:hypothetical protein
MGSLWPWDYFTCLGISFVKYQGLFQTTKIVLFFTIRNLRELVLLLCLLSSSTQIQVITTLPKSATWG